MALYIEGGGAVSLSERTISKQLKKTRRLDDRTLIDEHGPYTAFEDYPIKEIRQLCIDYFREAFQPDNLDSHAFWMEDRICQLLQLKDPLWEELLKAYLFPHSKTVDINVSSRAVQFACNLGIRYVELRSTIAKHITGKIKDRPRLSYVVNELYSFWTIILQELIPESDAQLPYRSYSDEEWYNVERALLVISQSLDTRHIDVVRNLFAQHSNHSIRPVNPPLFLHAKHQSVLTETLERLNCTETIGLPKLTAFIEKRLGLTDEHGQQWERIRIFCRYLSRTWTPKETVTITLCICAQSENTRKKITEILGETGIFVQWGTSFPWKPINCIDDASQDFRSGWKGGRFNYDLLFQMKAIPTEKKADFVMRIIASGKKKTIETIRGTVSAIE